MDGVYATGVFFFLFSLLLDYFLDSLAFFVLFHLDFLNYFDTGVVLTRLSYTVCDNSIRAFVCVWHDSRRQDLNVKDTYIYIYKTNLRLIDIVKIKFVHRNTILVWFYTDHEAI